MAKRKHKPIDLRERVSESHRCVDCGINTAPGMPDRVEAERQAKSSIASGKDTLFTARFTQDSEVYMVKPKVWKASGMADWGGCLCIGCLEKRIGRQLTPKDFLPNHPFNRDDYPASDRLLHRRSGEPVMLVNRQEGLCLVVEGTRIAIQRDGKTWVSLEPGWKVTGDLDLTIERDGKVWVP